MKKKDDKNELECKLREMASGMGYEIHKKFKKEFDPIHKTFQTLIIFGFLTVFMIMGTYLTISLTNTCHTCQEPKIVYVDKYVNKYIQVPVETLVEVPVYVEIPKEKGLTLIKVRIKKGREYRYYRKDTGDKWEFYTVATPIKPIKPICRRTK